MTDTTVPADEMIEQIIYEAFGLGSHSDAAEEATRRIKAHLAAQPSAGAQGEAVAWLTPGGDVTRSHAYAVEQSANNPTHYPKALGLIGAPDIDCVSLLADLDAGKPVGREAAATIRSLIAERATPSQPDTGDVAALRERIARVIDPKAWAKFDGRKNHGYADHVTREQAVAWTHYLQPSLTKAADILAALSKPNAQGAHEDGGA